MNTNNSNIIRYKYIIFCVFMYCSFLMFYSCNTKNGNKAVVVDSISNTSGKLKIEKLADIQLDYFDSIPNLFKYDGGDMYTYYSAKLDDKKYIFLSNLSGVAAVKINGNEIYLKPDSSQFTVRKNDSCQEGWIGNGIQIVLKLRIVRDFEEREGEGSYLEGVLELKTKNAMRKIKIHGYTEV